MKASPIASRKASVALLCLLSGSGWVFTQSYPEEIAPLSSTCIHFAMIGLVAALVWLRPGRVSLAGKQLAAIALAGAGLFALPAIVLRVSAGAVPEFFGVALFCAIPVMTVLLAGAFRSGSAGGANSLGLIASVVGLGGALRLFPVTLPSSTRGWTFTILIAFACVVISFAGVWMYKQVQGVAIAAVVAMASLGSVAALEAYGAFTGWPAISLRALGVTCFRCAVFDLPVVWLTLWIIREVEPTRLSARFLLAPLITAAEGYVAMRGGVDLSAGIAMILMAGGGVVLLLGDEGEEAASLHLR